MGSVNMVCYIYAWYRANKPTLYLDSHFELLICDVTPLLTSCDFRLLPQS